MLSSLGSCASAAGWVRSIAGNRLDEPGGRLPTGRGFQPRIVAMSGQASKIEISRLMLLASTCRLISLATLLISPVWKWVATIQALRVPKTCSSVQRWSRIAFGLSSSRRCTARSTYSCSQCVMRCCALRTQRVLIGHVEQADVPCSRCLLVSAHPTNPAGQVTRLA